MENFGGFLRDLRRERRFTLGQLSLRSGVNKATLSRWEAGTYLPQIPQLNRALDALDASPSVRASSLRLLDSPRALHAERSDASTPMRLSLGDLLFGLRQRAGKTQAEVARLTGVSRSLYSQWENDANQPDAGHLHAVGFALGASAAEVITLTSRTLATKPVEKNRDALLRQYTELMSWHEGVTEAAYKLHLFALLANYGRLLKAGDADIGDVALIINKFGDCAEMLENDTETRTVYHQRALALVAQAREPIHFHIVSAVRSQLLIENSPRTIKERVNAALEWQPRFQTKAGQAYLLSFIASAIAEEDSGQALRLADRYCSLVADDPDEYPCRLRDRGNLLLKCGRAAEAVTFIAALQAQDTFREGLKQLELAKSLTALGSYTEALACVAAGKRILSRAEFGFTQSRIEEVESAIP